MALPVARMSAATCGVLVSRHVGSRISLRSCGLRSLDRISLRLYPRYAVGPHPEEGAQAPVSKDGDKRPWFETRPISAFTRVCDALWGAPQHEGSGGLRCAGATSVSAF